MPKPIYVLLCLSLWAGWSSVLPAWGQAIIPYTLELEQKALEEEGLTLARQAAQLAQFQQFQPALARAQLATQLVPDNADAWFLLGRLQLQAGEFDRSITTLQKAQSLEPKNALILFTLGSVHFQMEDYQAVVRYTQEGLKIEPNRLEALFDLGNAYYKLNRWSEAIAQYKKAIKQDESFWPGINNIGLIQYEQGQADRAISNWRKAVSLEPDAAEPQLALAVALYAKGDRRQGLKIGSEALKHDPAYADLEFLALNLWGERLLADTKAFLETPQIQQVLEQAARSDLES
ncbi:tetratricopeptide repeat protein [Roseofilum casamattae]|uniref:Tetratricopeptide repeat protein n=1 Tax=Roseofilum casamattae BLCC-M143 TaxID=3022442 RepID=A0ABT7C111_9CYAN|nr:tetratricopeptide repeat protein [Roseofilum casamattae]MDJ1185145.1 tetratricopeptide repeat protein [Roseofilum casamattae BLCC-M143]